LEKKPDLVNSIDWDGVFRIIFDFINDFGSYRSTIEKDYQNLHNPFKVIQEMFLSFKIISNKSDLMQLMQEGLKNAIDYIDSTTTNNELKTQYSGLNRVPEFIRDLLDSISDKNALDSALNFLQDAKNCDELKSKFINIHFAPLDDTQRNVIQNALTF
jgi:GTP1/Obg family GTP-binding protein